MPKSGLPSSSHYDPDLDGWRAASWSPFTVSDTVTDFSFGGGRYVAVSSTGIIAWSDNGDIWHRAQRIVTCNKCDEILTIRLDAVNYTCTNYYCENNEEHEDYVKPVAIIEIFSFNAVCYGKNLFVAAGNNGVFAWSKDGKKWEAASMPGFVNSISANENINGIAWGGGYFVAVGTNAAMSYSSSGDKWNVISTVFSNNLNDIVFDVKSGRFFVVGDNGSRGWSANPVGEWKSKSPEHPFWSENITKVTVGRYGAGIGIGIVYNRKTAIATHEDFDHFDADVDAFLFNDNAINGIAWGGGYFVSAGTSAMIGYWPSGEPSREIERYWRALTFPEFRFWEISALKACNGRFFAGNVGGKIGYSK